MPQPTPSSQETPLTYRDHTTNILHLYEADHTTSPVILLLPALGVRAAYYQSFMAYAAILFFSHKAVELPRKKTVIDN